MKQIFLSLLALLMFTYSYSTPYTEISSNIGLQRIGIPSSKTIPKYMSPIISEGFDFPLGNKNDAGPYKGRYGINRDGWNITFSQYRTDKYGIQLGEVWDAIEHSTSDLNEHVYAISRGTIKKIELNVKKKEIGIMLQHIVLENGIFDTIYSVYKHLNPKKTGTNINIGDTVKKGQIIGSIGNLKENVPIYLRIEIRKSSIKQLPIYFRLKDKTETWKQRHFHQVSEFIKSNRKLIRPLSAKKLIIAIKKEYKLYFIENGKITDTLEIALGQSPKYHKAREGDNRTPEGEYKITQKAPGPFPGTIGPYFGKRWIRLSYPNWYDAENGFKRKIISKADKDRIQRAILNNKMPPKNTALGGGIGIHGWNGLWDEEGHRNITWGCISINNPELVKFYDRIEIGDTIIISQ